MSDGDAVAAAVDRAFPGATIRDRDPVETGNRKRTVVVGLDGDDGTRSVVVQVAPDGRGLRTEAALGRAVGARTDVPVPGVLAGGTHDPGDGGFLVTEHVSGDDLHERFVGLDDPERERVARSLGRALAQVHGAFEFDGFGPVGLDEPLGVDDGSDAAGGDDDRWTAVLEATDPGSLLRVRADATGRGAADAGDAAGVVGNEQWPAWLGRHADAGLRALPDGFDDLRPRLREAIEAARAGLPATPEARLYPWDLRPGNALVADGRVSAVLDWGEPLAAAPGLSLAKAEHLVCDWYVEDGAPLRRAFRAGYRSERPLPSVPDAYRLVAVIRSAVDGDGAVTRPRYPELTGEDAVAFHRDRLLAALDG